jgi:hypothetical protein
LIYGSGHLYRTGGITKALHDSHRGQVFVVGVIGGNNPVYGKLEEALSTSKRPVLVSLRGTPFGSFSANEFLGGELKVVKGLRATHSLREALANFFGRGTQDAPKLHLQEVPPFQPQATLGDVEDACVYLGGTADVGDLVKPDSAIYNQGYQAEIDRRRTIIAAGPGAR